MTISLLANSIVAFPMLIQDNQNILKNFLLEVQKGPKQKDTVRKQEQLPLNVGTQEMNRSKFHV